MVSFDGRTFGAGAGYLRGDLSKNIALEIAKTSPAIRKEIARWARTYHKDIENNGGPLVAKANRDMAHQARQAIYLAYSAALFNKPSYRHQDPGKLKRGGSAKLGKVLKSESMVKGSAEGILFLQNQRDFDRAAKFWFRLNFGTDAASENRKQMFNTAAGNRRQKGFDLSEYSGQGSEIVIPAGFFFSGTLANKSRQKSVKFGPGTLAMYPRFSGQRFKKGFKPRATYSARVATHQFRGHHFMEVGAELINEQWPKKLEKALTDAGIIAKSKLK